MVSYFTYLAKSCKNSCALNLLEDTLKRILVSKKNLLLV